MHLWSNATGIRPKQYKCGYCGHVVASATGYHTNDPREQEFVCLCPNCGRPTYFGDRGQIPGLAPGNEVGNVPDDVGSLYAEARNCVAARAYTAAVLCCRKLLMNIAVALGAKSGESFLSYVEFLAARGYVPPNGRGWVDHIRQKGNEATHEIRLMAQGDAEELIVFAEMLLKFIYEFPSRVPQKNT
jgi:Domain of unknown function (DUF4145)